MITVFCKTAKTKEGKTFPIFVSRLGKKDGTNTYVTVRFPEDNKPDPKKCPANIDLVEGNLSRRESINEETGETYEHFTLWVKKWEYNAEPYVDHSLDDYNL